MQTNQNIPGPSRGRFIAGLIVGVLIFIIPSFFSKSNVILLILGMVIAIDIAHLSRPRDTELMGALIGVVFGLFGAYYTSSQTYSGELSLGQIMIICVTNVVIGGVFYGGIGLLAGWLLRSYRKSHGFFL
jgi:hypothetical protein